MTYPMTIAGLRRELPLCKVADDFYIGAFIMFGDAEITVACAKELLARAPKEYDYLLTAEAKSIPLIHEMARQSGASEYFVARKGMKVYLTNPIHVQVHSITTQHDQDLYLSGEDAAKMKGKKVLIVDDVISTGESLHALEELVHQAGGEVAGRMAVLAEGDAQKREDIVQTAVVSLLRKEATLRRLPPYAQINYIAAAVRNTAINALKREQKELDRCISLEDLTETFPTQFMPSAEAIILEKELQKDLLAVFQEMKEDEQQLLMGKYLMDLSDAELAQTLGCKASSVRMKLTRARRTFMKKLQDGGDDNAGAGKAV